MLSLEADRPERQTAPTESSPCTQTTGPLPTWRTGEGVSQWAMARAQSIRSRWGVRKRSVLIATAVVFLALLGGGALLVLVLQSALATTTKDSTTSRAIGIADLATQNGLTAAVSEVEADSHPAELLQIVSPDHHVLAASRTRIGGRPLAHLFPAPGATASVKADIEDVGSSDDFLIVAHGFEIGNEPYVVQVAAPVEVQAETIQTVALFLLGATPLLLVVVGVAVWILVGRALQPVEIIRSQVAQIDAQRLGKRVAVPPTADEIAALATTMNMMLDRLEASDKAQRSFVSDASHEMRSPLSTVITAAEVLAADPTEAPRAQRLETILWESTRMRFLVDNLMTLAKADSHDLALQMVDVDLDDVVDGEVRHLRTTSPHRIRANTPPARLVGDPRRLTQVIRNLLENADRHARTAIDVAVLVRRDWVILRVDNDGDVIDESLREHVFERFVRLDGSRSRDSGGSGLGLAISAEIVHAHQGTIVATETDVGWCRFEVVLPRRQLSERPALSLDSASMGHDEPRPVMRTGRGLGRRRARAAGRG